MPPWTNPYLLVAICVSIGLHCLIMCVCVCELGAEMHGMRWRVGKC
jgi:hypothetical protein